MPINPFEPPRTTDLDGGGSPAAAVGSGFVSAEALHELAATTRWVRWLARVTLLEIAVQILKLAARFTPTAPRKPGWAAPMIVSIAVSILILRVLRRYAAASARLPADPPGATRQIISAQASYFKLLGVLLVIVLGAAALVLVAFFGSVLT